MLPKLPLLTLLGFVILPLHGCATAPPGAVAVASADELPSVQQAKAALLSKLHIGMTLKEFQNLVPEAYVAAQNHQTTGYELVHVQKYVSQEDIDRQNFLWGAGSPSARTTKQTLWFYFFKNQLVKWGRPQDWPANPDLIIEQRNR